MRLFTGNRFTTPRFNYPVFKFEKARGYIVGRNKLPRAWYSPYNRSFTLFEHSLRLRRGKLYDVCIRGFWHDGIAYPMSATVSKFIPHLDGYGHPELYVIDAPLPPYFCDEYEFINPLEINGNKARVFRFEPKFNGWFKDRLVCTGLERDRDDAEREILIDAALATLPDAEVTETVQGVTLYADTRAQWLGKLTFPMWSRPEDTDTYVNAIKTELKARVNHAC